MVRQIVKACMELILLTVIWVGLQGSKTCLMAIPRKSSVSDEGTLSGDRSSERLSPDSNCHGMHELS
jgi:hypothetical protein